MNVDDIRREIFNLEAKLIYVEACRHWNRDTSLTNDLIDLYLKRKDALITALEIIEYNRIPFEDEIIHLENRHTSYGAPDDNAFIEMGQRAANGI